MTPEQEAKLKELDEQVLQLQEERQALMEELGMPALGPGPRTAEDIKIIEEEGLIPMTDEVKTISTDEQGNVTTSEVSDDDLLRAIRLFGKGGRR